MVLCCWPGLIHDNDDFKIGLIICSPLRHKNKESNKRNPQPAAKVSATLQVDPFHLHGNDQKNLQV